MSWLKEMLEKHIFHLVWAEGRPCHQKDLRLPPPQSYSLIFYIWQGDTLSIRQIKAQVLMFYPDSSFEIRPHPSLANLSIQSLPFKIKLPPPPPSKKPIGFSLSLSLSLSHSLSPWANRSVSVISQSRFNVYWRFPEIKFTTRCREGICQGCLPTRSRFLRRIRPDLTRSLLYLERVRSDLKRLKNSIQAQSPRSWFLRRFRSHLTRSLSTVKSELGPT